MNDSLIPLVNYSDVNMKKIHVYLVYKVRVFDLSPLVYDKI